MSAIIEAEHELAEFITRAEKFFASAEVALAPHDRNLMRDARALYRDVQAQRVNVITLYRSAATLEGKKI